MIITKRLFIVVLCIAALLFCSNALIPEATSGTVRRVGYIETDPENREPVIDYDMAEKQLSEDDVKEISRIFRRYKPNNTVFDCADTHRLTIGSREYRYNDNDVYVEYSGKSFFLSEEDNVRIKEIFDRYTLKNGAVTGSASESGDGL